MTSLIERLRLGEGSSPDHFLLLEAADALEKSLTTTGRPRKETMMDEATERLRINALDNAVRHRIKDESAEQVVENAKKYFEFLQGNEPK